ncbi:putative sugar nucleotidyl transferase [Blattabacterium cuenoti]|uniref:putative sugar nucleotidyl transferase n=1 Tax=Blattabacterium cuenoti TaxID=1653831 RepID=UPI00163C4FB3|nr:putative sugar nucleotidyl transferase [Blattabacterium cuenoti]
MNFILYDGKEWNHLFPITLTRSISEIRMGMFTMKERWEIFLKEKIKSIFTRSFLMKKNDFFLDKKKNEFRDIYLINSSFIPNEELIYMISLLENNQAILFKNQIVVEKKKYYSYEEYNKNISFYSFNDNIKKEFKKTYSVKQVIQIQHLWNLFMQNEFILKSDFLLKTKNKTSYSCIGTNYIIQKNNLFLEENIETNNVVFDAKSGPIYIEKGVKIMEGSVMKGPIFIGNNTILNVGSRIYGGTTIGSFCKIGGEIRKSIIFSYSNKAHDGFLGNSVLGEWCNLGASTNVSNLRNDYQYVTIWNYQKKLFYPINVRFFGMIMGDHSKSSINTQFNTATIVGVSSNIFGYGFPPRFIPSFSLGGRQNMEKISMKKVFETSKIVMKRRNKIFSCMEKKVLEYLYHISDI